MNSKAVVLLSGGLDSTTVAAMVNNMGLKMYTLSFSYGQKHSCELVLARENSERFNGVRHTVVTLDPEPFRTSSLVGTAEVPDGGSTGIPSTYVPARNTVFLSMALGLAESIQADHIFTGVNAMDYSGYPDCRPEFIEAFQRLASVATRRAVEGSPPKIHAPLMHMTKKQIIATGLELGVDYGRTLSCYRPDPQGRSCGGCDSCLIRLKAFRELGAEDPADYV